MKRNKSHKWQPSKDPIVIWGHGKNDIFRVRKLPKIKSNKIGGYHLWTGRLVKGTHYPNRVFVGTFILGKIGKIHTFEATSTQNPSRLVQK